jgi:hypothetical protein
MHVLLLLANSHAFRLRTHYFNRLLASVTIPDSVTNIGDGAFCVCSKLSSITIPNSVISIGEDAFYDCPAMTNVLIGNRVVSIGNGAFHSCGALTSITIGNTVSSIGENAFEYCTSITNIIIPRSVANIGQNAFYLCTHLTGVYFKGNAPATVPPLFNGDDNVTVYYLPGTEGWASPFAEGLAPVLWNVQVQTSGASLGVRTNRFGSNITGSSGLVVVVEASTNLANPVWYPLQTITLTGSPVYFTDPQWTNHNRRFYGLGVP